MQLSALFAASFLFLTGRIEATLPALLQEARQGTNLEAERKELAAIRLTVAAERQFAEAKQRLLALDQTLATSTDVDARALRAELATLLSEVRRTLGEVQAPSGGKIDEAARSAIQQGDYAFIAQLGAAAAPALREEVLRQPDFLPSEVLADPFYHLLEADPLAASALCEQLAGQSGFFWKRRVLRALLESEGFARKAYWNVAGESAVPGLVRQYEALLADPETRSTAMQFVTEFLDRPGSLTPTLRGAYVQLLMSPDVDLREQARGLMRHDSAILAEVLKSSDASLRAWAAGELSSGDSEFLAVVADPDESVRQAVADRLASAGPADWNERKLVAFQRLALDPSPKVRGAAMRACESFPTQEVVHEDLGFMRRVHTLRLSTEFLGKLAESEFAYQRQVLAESILAHEQPEVALPLLERLAGDAEAEVALAASRRAWVFKHEPRGVLRVFEKTLANPVLSAEQKRKQLAAPEFSSMLRTAPTRPVVLGWALELQDPGPIGALELFASRDLPGLSGELLRAYCERTFAERPRRVWELLRHREPALEPGQVEALGALARETSAPAGLRLLALGAALRGGAPAQEFTSVLPALFGAESWAGLDSKGEVNWPMEVREVVQRLPDALVNPCLLALLNVPRVEPGLLVQAMQELEPAGEGAKSLLASVLQAHYGAEDRIRQELTNLALRVMGQAPGLAAREWLERGARDPRYAYAALSAIGSLRDPSYLPLLDELARTPAVGLVANALENYLTNEAGEILLVAATKLSGEPRDAVLAHLKKIREYQDARAEWATRKTSQQTRAQVIAELVAKLDAKSEEVKVEAIRALATWEAVEAMPRLIELTQSGSKSVAAAARAALERLNAPKETTGG